MNITTTKGKAMNIQWETFEGETTGYLDDGSEIAITARRRYNRWGGEDSNVREWSITDPNNNRIASGKAEGLREAKSAALKTIAAWHGDA